MDKIYKFLQKLSSDERKILEDIIKQVKKGDLGGLDVKKLKGESNLFRIRRGDIRIIFLKNKNMVMLISVDRRSDNTYK